MTQFQKVGDMFRIRALEEENACLRATVAILGGDGVVFREGPQIPVGNVDKASFILNLRDVVIKVPIPPGFRLQRMGQPELDVVNGTVSVRVEREDLPQ